MVNGNCFKLLNFLTVYQVGQARDGWDEEDLNMDTKANKEGIGLGWKGRKGPFMKNLYRGTKDG